MKDVINGRNARLAIYIIFAVGSLVMSYLAATEKWDIGPHEIALYAGLVALVNGLAGLNINPPAGKNIGPK